MLHFVRRLRWRDVLAFGDCGWPFGSFSGRDLRAVVLTPAFLLDFLSDLRREFVGGSDEVATDFFLDFFLDFFSGTCTDFFAADLRGR